MTVGLRSSHNFHFLRLLRSPYMCTLGSIDLIPGHWTCQTLDEVDIIHLTCRSICRDNLRITYSTSQSISYLVMPRSRTLAHPYTSRSFVSCFRLAILLYILSLSCSYPDIAIEKRLCVNGNPPAISTLAACRRASLRARSARGGVRQAPKVKHASRVVTFRFGV